MIEPDAPTPSDPSGSRSNWTSPPGSGPDRLVSRMGDRRVFLALLLLSLIVLAIAQTRETELELPHDSAHYLELARSLNRGEGFWTQTRWALNIATDRFPHPDTYRSPLYPLLIAGASRIIEDPFTSAKWVNVFFGAFIPPLVFLFTRRRLGLNPMMAGLAGIMTLTHHHLLGTIVRPLTEATFTLGVVLTLYLVTSPRPRPPRVGLVTGLTWLARTQGLLLVPTVLVAMIRPGMSFRRWLGWSAVFGITTLVVIAPWLLRMDKVAGAPFYSDLRYHFVSTYDPDSGIFEYFHGLTPAPEPADHIIEHPEQSIRHFVKGVQKIVRMTPGQMGGNPVYVILSLIGVVTLWRWRRTRPVLIVLAVYTALTMGLVAASFTGNRHLVSLDPIGVMLAVAGMVGLWDALGRSGHRLGRLRLALPLVIILAIGWEIATGARDLSRDSSRRLQEAVVVEPFIGGHIGPEQSVMADKPYYYSYLYDRRAVSFPWCTDSEFRDLVDRYRVRFVCVGKIGSDHPYPGGFLERGEVPEWLREVGRVTDPPVIVYEVILDEDGTDT